MSSDDEATISIPSIAFVAVLGYILYRFFWSARPDPSSTSSSTRTRPAFTSVQVDQIAQMFPQLNRRDIMWALHRNRGNVQATTERVLMGGRLEPVCTSQTQAKPSLTVQAPPSYQPPMTTSPTTTTNVAAVLSAAPEPDLITRYNLQTRLDDKGKDKEEANHGWSSSKDERQAMLQRRRDEMILAARRKMQERDSSGTSTPAAS